MWEQGILLVKELPSLHTWPVNWPFWEGTDGEGGCWEWLVTVKWPFVDILCWTTLLDFVSASPLPPVDFLLDSSFTIQAPSFRLCFQYDCFVCWPLLYPYDCQTIKGAVRGFSRTEKLTRLSVENYNNDCRDLPVQQKTHCLPQHNGDHLKAEKRDSPLNSFSYNTFPLFPSPFSEALPLLRCNWSTDLRCSCD